MCYSLEYDYVMGMFFEIGFVFGDRGCLLWCNLLLVNLFGVFLFEEDLFLEERFKIYILVVEDNVIN